MTAAKELWFSKVVAPVGGTLVLPGAGPSTLDGRQIHTQRGVTAVKVGPGEHTLIVTLG